MKTGDSRRRLLSQVSPVAIILLVALCGVLVGLQWVETGYAATDCGPDPCPGTTAAIWPHPSATLDGMVRILGWNLAPYTVYEVILVGPDGVAIFDGYVATDIEGGILGRFDDVYGQPYVCTPPALGLEGIYQVLIYPSPWSGSLDEVPAAATTFYHN